MKERTEKILDNHSNADRDSLIPILQEVQDSLGWLSEESLTAIGKHLDIPVSKVYGVATFYNQFRFQAQGKNHIQVCRGTACHVLGSATVLDELKKKLKIGVDETTKDGQFSLEIVACIGTCGLAPVIKINDNFHANVTSESLDEILESYKEKVNS